MVFEKKNPRNRLQEELAEICTKERLREKILPAPSFSSGHQIAESMVRKGTPFLNDREMKNSEPFSIRMTAEVKATLQNVLRERKVISPYISRISEEELDKHNLHIVFRDQNDGSTLRYAHLAPDSLKRSVKVLDQIEDYYDSMAVGENEKGLLAVTP